MIDTWQISDGLPQNSGYSLVQTNDGFIWIATQEGLARFDGVEFENFNRHNTPELSSNWIRTLFQDSHQNLWIGTNGGITILTLGRFINIPILENIPDKKIRAVAEDEQGGFWIGTDGGGLIHYSNGKIKYFNTGNGLSDNRVYSICIDDKGIIYAGTSNGLNLINGETIQTFFVRQGLFHNTVLALLKSHSGQVWIGTDKGINIYDNGKLTKVTTRGLSDTKVRTIYEDINNQFWVGTDGGGLYRLIGNTFEGLKEKDGLPNNTIFSIIGDREGNFWIGSHGGGISRLKEGKFSNFTTIEGLVDNDIYTVFQDSKKRIWAGTTKGPSYILNNRVISTNLPVQLSQKMITAFFEDPAGSIWFGTNGQGVYKWDGKNTTQISSRQGLSNDRIYAINGDHIGNIWVGTWRGLNKLGKNGVHKYLASDGLTHEKIRCILEDRQGVIWIGTDGGGLNYIVGNKINAYTTQDGLASNFISCLYEDAEGKLWIGMFDGGLAVLNDGRITNFTMENGLFDNAAYGILEDKQGFMWFSSNNGIFKVKKQNLLSFAEGETDTIHSISYGRGDGMKSRECNGGVQPAAWKSVDGKLWFPTVAGLAVINPEKISKNTTPPSLFIREIRVDDKVKKKNISVNPQKITLAPGKTRIEIDYAGLSLSDPRKIHYKYILSGAFKTWIDAGNRRTAYFTNLNPGEYTFKVIAANEDGIWNLEGSTIRFILEPFFYQTYWFYILSAAFISLIILSVFRFRVRRLEKNRRELEAVVSQRTKQLQQANDELKRLSNEDEMTGIANHRRFLEFLQLEWKRAIRNKSSISLILFDVDKFKDINDNFGHQAGNVCLKNISAALVEVINRPGDLVARYAGDEFVVVLTDTGHEGVENVVENLRKKVAGTQFTVSEDGSSIRATISLGFATVIPGVGLKSDMLIKAADDQLYEAKSKGRNCSSGIDLNALDQLSSQSRMSPN